jgi:hypothetical protein
LNGISSLKDKREVSNLTDALLVDGLEDDAGLIEALQKSTDYDVLPLRGKINYWETKNLSIMNRVRFLSSYLPFLQL